LKPVENKSILIYIFFLILLASILNSLSFKVLKVTIDDNYTLLFEATSINITLVLKHSYLLTEVREIYDIRNDQICVNEVMWPIGGAGAPASVNDLTHLRGAIKVEGGSYVVTNAEYCLGKSLVISTAFMIDWKIIINGYEVMGGKEVKFELNDVRVPQYLMTKL